MNPRKRGRRGNAPRGRLAISGEVRLPPALFSWERDLVASALAAISNDEQHQARRDGARERHDVAEA